MHKTDHMGALATEECEHSAHKPDMLPCTWPSTGPAVPSRKSRCSTDLSAPAAPPTKAPASCLTVEKYLLCRWSRGRSHIFVPGFEPRVPQLLPPRRSGTSRAGVGAYLAQMFLEHATSPQLLFATTNRSLTDVQQTTVDYQIKPQSSQA